MADFTWVYENLAVGGGIYTAENMAEIAEAGITHIVCTQAEFDDTPLAVVHGIQVLWVPMWDNFNEPPSISFHLIAEFAEKTILVDPNVKVLVHCAGGVHRGPMACLLVAMLCGISRKDAVEQIENTRLIASFPLVYRGAVEKFVAKRQKHQGK